MGAGKTAQQTVLSAATSYVTTMADMASVNTDDICVDFGQICRVCLKNCGKMFALKGHPSEYYDLGGMSLETKDLSSKLAALTGIGVCDL